jgi:hypothetical protein
MTATTPDPYLHTPTPPTIAPTATTASPTTTTATGEHPHTGSDPLAPILIAAALVVSGTILAIRARFHPKES